MMKIRYTIITLVTTAILGSSALRAGAAPVVSSVTYDVQANKVTVIGNGFGDGPNVALFDDFDHGAEGGEVVDPHAARFPWTSIHQYYPPLYDSRSHSGTSSALMYDMDNTRARQLTKQFEDPIQSVFVSFWVNVPDGTYFPGSYTTEFEQFPWDSSWKFSWLIDEDTGTESSNVCAPTHIGQGIFYVAGNDMNVMKITGNDWWSWRGWNRLTTTLLADADFPSVNGFTQFTALSLEKGLFSQDQDAAVFDEDGGVIKQYKTINIPGWIRDSGANQVEVLYDDVYVASGLNAAKRIELTDNISYPDVNMASIQIAEMWTDTKIVFIPRKGGLSDIINSKIHFIDATGNAHFIQSFPSESKAPPRPPVLK
jgi:hypothetical protein